MNVLRKYRKPVAATVIASMTAMSVPLLPAHAAIIGTDKVIEQTQGSGRDRVNAFLARNDVKDQLQSLGISPAEAQSRVDALSDQEVDKIAGKLDTLPSGQGAIGAIIAAGVLIFLVLLLTDLLGLTHVFSFTNKGSAKAK